MNYELAPQYMSLELAIELQKAGFTRTFNGNAGVEVMVSSDAYTGLVYLPTLEELIEACGKDFRFLIHEKDVRSRSEWRAGGGRNVWLEDNENWGKTPTEAVARLWLELNKKT